jgi:3-deoxy-manno-octulosonate cytidylyltransferase (CMP-KDO synthetase)
VTAVVAIPARLRSSRLPRKVLSDIGGRSMLERTHEIACAARCGRVVVLADAAEVMAEARSFGAAAIMTDPGLESGTARIASVVERLDADIVVNLQADAPFLDPTVVARSVREAERSAAPVAIPVAPIGSTRELLDPSVVKVIRARDGQALYFSRSPVPFVRDAAPSQWHRVAPFWAHVGLYAYHRGFLERFGTLPPSRLELAERLEQLRWLEAGVRLHTFEVEPQPRSVDTPADLEHARARIAVGAAG